MRELMALLMLASAACSSEVVTPPPKPPIGSLEPVSHADPAADVVTAKERALPELYVRALSTSAPGGAPFSSLAPLLNPDLAEFSSPGMPPAHDAAGILAAHAALFGAFDGRSVTVTRVWRTPNEQSVEWTMTGTQAREWMGVAATHKPVSVQGITLLWTKDDGTLVDIHVYFDVGLVKAQLTGVGPKELLAVPARLRPTGPAQVFEQTPESGPLEQAAQALVKGWLDALENSREAEYLGVLTDDVTVQTLEGSTPMKGKDDARKYYRAAHKAVGQLDTTINNAWAVGPFVVIEYDIDGEQLGAFGWVPLLAGLPARNTRLAHFDIVDIVEVVGGKIGRVWRYDNPVEVLGGSAATVAGDAGKQ